LRYHKDDDAQEETQFYSLYNLCMVAVVMALLSFWNGVYLSSQSIFTTNDENTRWYYAINVLTTHKQKQAFIRAIMRNAAQKLW